MQQENRTTGGHIAEAKDLYTFVGRGPKKLQKSAMRLKRCHLTNRLHLGTKHIAHKPIHQVENLNDRGPANKHLEGHSCTKEKLEMVMLATLRACQHHSLCVPVAVLSLRKTDQTTRSKTNNLCPLRL